MNGVYLLIILLIIGAAVYTVIPDLFLHRLGVGSWKRQYGPGVVLTFDDGPNPDFTPRVLDILNQYKVKATFFLVGEHARQNPGLVKRIAGEGHAIGAHSQSHKYAWFATPLQTWRGWEQNVTILEELTGNRIEWIRPPWGTFNLMTFLWMKIRRKKAILWSAEGHDWQSSRSPEEIAVRILKKTREGTIIILHDNGGEPGAPENSLKALDILCSRIVNEYKIPLVPLQLPDWTLGRRLSFLIWEKWEHFFEKRYKVERVDSTAMLKLSKTRYYGPELYSETGTLLAAKGDIVGEIHIDSIRLREKGTDMQKIAVRALRQARDSLPALAQFIQKNPGYNDIKVFVGFTLINRGVKGLGFKVQELNPSWFGLVVSKIQKGIMAVYHPAGRKRFNERLGDQPKLVWISRETLFERWLSQGKET